MSNFRKNELIKTIAKYSVCYLIFAFFCVIIFFWLDKKSMLDIYDGLYQHYVYFIGSGQLIRAFFKNIFIDHVFELPMWNTTMGMGSDQFISTVAANNFFFDPLYWVSAITPIKYSEYVFNIIVMLKLYISGLAFIAYVNEKGYKGNNAIAGSLVYVFSSTTYAIFLEQSFSSSFICFPLLLLGADRVWRKKSVVFYVIILCYSFLRSFYFTYMMIILLFAYCLIRYLCEKEYSVKKLFGLIGKYTFLSIISVSIGTGFILPALINLSKLSRLETQHEVKLLDLKILSRFFAYGFSVVQASGTNDNGDSLIGISAFAFVAFISLLVSKKKEPVIKWCFSLCLLSFAFPFIRSVFNGFSYPTTRYIFSLLFCASYIVTVSFNEIKCFKGKYWLLSLFLSILYSIICFVFIDKYSFISAISLFITVLLIGIINTFERYIKAFRDYIFLFVIFISCVYLSYRCIHTYLMPVMADSGSMYETMFISGGMDIRKSVNNTMYRTEVLETDFFNSTQNSCMVAEVNGFDFYHSNQNRNIQNYYTDLAVLGNPTGFFSGFRGRCYLEILNGCKYIVRSNNNSACIRAPYSYNYVKTNGDYSLYESERGVSLVYFYDNTISTDTFMEMDPVLRETNLMYSMVIDKPRQGEAEIISDFRSIPFEITETNNVAIYENRLSVQEDGGYIVLKPDIIEPGQVSIYITGIESLNDSNIYRILVALKDTKSNPIVLDSSAHCSTSYVYYTGNDDIFYSFESVNETTDSIKIIFQNYGEYTFDDIRVYSRPYEQMDKTLDAFYEHADMEDITYDYHGNHLDIKANTDTDRYLFIAVPYSEGWHAKVDGTSVEIIRANTAFMAIPLSAGSHSIEMTYVTPYLYLGWIISAAGIILYAVYLVCEKKKRK